MDDPIGVRRSERETLDGTLSWFRAIVENKVDGLDFEQASRILTPTGLSLLGIVKHLGWVERGWFQDVLAGAAVRTVDIGGDKSVEFAIESDDTIDSVLAFYRAEVAQSRRIADDHSLDDLSQRSTDFAGHVSLRWILVHMIEETARHIGHMDILREQIDGRTGD